MSAGAPHGLAQWLPIALAWIVGAFGGGAVLAGLYKRLHPELAFYKLWATWTTVLATVVALLLVFGRVRL